MNYSWQSSFNHTTLFWMIKNTYQFDYIMDGNSHLAVEGPTLAVQLDVLSSIVVKYCLNE